MYIVHHCPYKVVIDVVNKNIEALSYQLVKALKDKAEAEAREKMLRVEIQAEMAANKLKTASNRFLTINYKGEGCRSSLDTKMIAKKYPEVLDDSSCWKESKVKPYILVKLKKDALIVMEGGVNNEIN